MMARWSVNLVTQSVEDAKLAYQQNGPNTALKRNTLECARCELILEDKMMTCESSQASFSEYNAPLSDTTNWVFIMPAVID